MSKSHKSMTLSACFLIMSLFCSGCNSSAADKMEAFSKSISEFSTNVSDINKQINEIDASADDASQQLLSCLDQLDKDFSELADMEIPAQYDSISSLADEASENMSQAVTFYHTAYESDPFSEQDAEVAYQYYTRAMTRLNYIGTILQGKLPEGDNVTINETTPSNEMIQKLTE